MSDFTSDYAEQAAQLGRLKADMGVALGRVRNSEEAWRRTDEAVRHAQAALTAALEARNDAARLLTAHDLQLADRRLELKNACEVFAEFG